MPWCSLPNYVLFFVILIKFIEQRSGKLISLFCGIFKCNYAFFQIGGLHVAIHHAFLVILLPIILSQR